MLEELEILESDVKFSPHNGSGAYVHIYWLPGREQYFYQEENCLFDVDDDEFDEHGEVLGPKEVSSPF